jgi:site-specific DNA recombinase
MRCAIYTRKSCEEGLELEYNSLDAQRDACKNYILSQKSEGWSILNEEYDDGGFSGGNIERPALKRLMSDIKAGKINIVVVYKIDRLSRSLSDFSKLVDVFDEYKVSFVSVTQQFNTNTSTGRLMLNMLLSFAQYEREVTGDRIRDKIRAQKARGMWTGGFVPLGYDTIEKKLVINNEESQIIRCIFNTFIQTGSVAETVRVTKTNNYKTKTQISKKTGELIREGKDFDRGIIYKLLKNKIYCGYIENKNTGDTFKGEHEPIITEEQFQEVREIINDSRNNNIYNVVEGEVKDANSELKKRNYRQYKKTNFIPNKEGNTPYLLKGLMKCNCCNSILTPTYTKKSKSNTIYRYYKPNKAMKQGIDTECKIGNVHADQIEKIVLNQVYTILKDTKIIIKTIEKLKVENGKLKIKNKDESLNNKNKQIMSAELTQNSNFQPSTFNSQLISEQEIINSLKNIEAVWDELFPREQLEIIHSIINEIIASETNVKIIFNTNGLVNIMNDANENLNLQQTTEEKQVKPTEINIPVNFRKRGGKSFITMPHGKSFSIQTTDSKTTPIHNNRISETSIVKALIQAQEWQDEITKNKHTTIATIAQREQKQNGYICQIYNLNFLAPDIKKAILTNNIPVGFSLRELKCNMPVEWEEQRRVWGFC